MSDEIFEVATAFADVAELGQGYVDRVDGERILLSLPRAVEEGEGVRFIVHLVDGTPAFAGAGRCIQVSDQGAQAAAAERFETLLDSLAFDERSAPVYEYIVAVRQMAYSEASAGAGASAPVEEAVYESEETNTHVEAVTSEDPASAQARAQEKESLAPVDAVEPVLSSIPPTLSAPPQPTLPSSVPPPPVASFVPAPLPTGILTRPAIAAHWVPAAPRPPQRSMRPMRFQYPPGPLPSPSAPPRPQLDRSRWIERAEGPR